MYEDDNLRDWQERHPDSKREAARRRFKERPYQLVVLEEMRAEQENVRRENGLRT